MQGLSRDESAVPELLAEVCRISLDFLADARNADVVNTQPHPRVIQDILASGGLVSHVRQRLLKPPHS